MGRSRTLPIARNNKLVVQELPDEMLIYDKERHKAYYLAPGTALVWKHCNGKTKFKDMADILENELKVSTADEEVKMALVNLKRWHLLGQ